MATRDGSDGADARRAPVGSVVLATVAFLSELVLLATLGLVGWRLGSGGLVSIAAAALCPSLAALIWSVWLAPGSTHRLGDPARLIAQISLFAGAAILCALSGLVIWGSVLAGTGIGAFLAQRRTAARADTDY